VEIEIEGEEEGVLQVGKRRFLRLVPGGATREGEQELG